MYNAYMQKQLPEDRDSAPEPKPEEPKSEEPKAPAMPQPVSQPMQQNERSRMLPQFKSSGLFSQLPNALRSHSGGGLRLDQLLEGDNWIVLAALLFLLNEDGTIDLDLAVIAGILLLLGF